ncbi:MAG TPA: polyphosphate kinase 2 family protein [Gemmatimonadales bacterium]|nr:polyphosphate kinase 2 family protein [Gemmatimonadales bacterium]
MLSQKTLDRLRVPRGIPIRLKDYDPRWAAIPELADLDEEDVEQRAREALKQNLDELAEAQELLWANDVWSVLVVLQAMDTAGKDSVIKHVMSGINPQGCQVFSYKRPSEEELDHNFLWRYTSGLPERGRIGIFNRSYYEEVLVVKVRPEILERQRLPPGKRDRKFWDQRYDDINRFEKHLVRNGTVILKFFLHISREEQRQRLLARLENPKKHWKFQVGDLAERALWDRYMKAYEAAISATSTRWAPWHIIPANHKWVARALVGAVLSRAIRKLDLQPPAVSPQERQAFAEARRQLEDENKGLRT